MTYQSELCSFVLLMMAYLMMLVATEACRAEWYNVKWTTE